MLVKTSTIAMFMAVASVSAKAKPHAQSVQPDFGFCVPTMKFEGGLGGRQADEFAFRPIDPVVAQEQNSAMDPNIIAAQICEALAGACEANEAAQALCLDAKAQIKALGTRDQTTADNWNDIIASGHTPAVTPELKKRDPTSRPERRQIEFRPCDAERWIDDCTGWPRKREESVSEAAPVKRSEAMQYSTPVKRDTSSSEHLNKRQIPFRPCDAEQWIDDCTGWP
ncbi:hypothetical protein LTR84_004328 [Exophiala bonariae]|uniref:Uncharacterized protein n=1 Tax=Exophiala bonariae TaxID=1690606 RepID=A0AAV9N8J6_9EURO|nr:hypothetical protein LTR84_004328 [Exophiala bonariae]